MRGPRDAVSRLTVLQKTYKFHARIIGNDCELPDWDLVYLSACPNTYGPRFQKKRSLACFTA